MPRHPSTITDSILSEVNHLVESIKHFAGVEHVYLFENLYVTNQFKIAIVYRNRVHLSIMVKKSLPPNMIYKTESWKKIGESHNG